MARCTKCGRQGNWNGDLCSACQSGVTYHYVERQKKKKVKRSKRLLRAWGSLAPVDKKRVRRQAIIVAVAVIIIATALILLHPNRDGNESLEDPGRSGAMEERE